MIRSLFLALALGLPSAGLGQTAIPCDGWQSSAQNIVEPWARYSRTFSNGQVRIALLDTVEPAAAAFYLLVLTPPYDELGSRTCVLIAEGDGRHGFTGIDFERTEATYDPAAGLTIAMPIQRYLPETGGTIGAQLAVTINQATGQILVNSR